MYKANNVYTLVKNTNHHLSLQWIIIVTLKVTDTNHHNEYNNIEKVWSVANYQNVTQRHEKNKCCWRNNAEDFLNTGSQQNFSLWKTQYLQSVIKQSTIKKVCLYSQMCFLKSLFWWYSNSYRHSHSPSPSKKY